MSKKITDKMFVKEMAILWQNIDIKKRFELSDLICNFYNKGNRAIKIIERMQADNVNNNYTDRVVENPPLANK